MDHRWIIGNDARFGETWKQGRPVLVLLEDGAEYGERFVNSPHIDKGNPVPEFHLYIVGRETFGRAVFFERSLWIVFFDGQIAGIHVVIRSMQGDKAAARRHIQRAVDVATTEQERRFALDTLRMLDQQ